jgi:hypothetical protein
VTDRRLAAVTALTALALLAAGCGAGAGAAATHTTGSGATYAVFDVHGTYPAARSGGLGGPIVRRHFALRCPTRKALLALRGGLGWRERLCFAVLDYQAAPKRAINCMCVRTVVGVTVRGVIDGRRVQEVFTPCVCNQTGRVRRDVRVILRTHPRRD